ncbi:MAG: SBBP repeat-containing protein [Phycisphaeraceae bacterium]
MRNRYFVAALACATLAFGWGAFADEPAYSPAFSTYLGGSSWEQARGVVADDDGYLYVVGGGNSANFPTTEDAYSTTYNGVPGSPGVGNFGPSDVYASKFSPTGELIWSTFLGGTGYDRAYAVDLDPDNNLVIAGRAGRNFPVTNGAFQTNFAGTSSPSNYGDQNAFVAKLSNDGGSLLWASYVGTASLARNVAVDKDGDIYLPLVMESNSSRTLPAAFDNAFDNAFMSNPPGNNSSGLVKIRGDGSAVEWATWLGGSGNDMPPASVRVDDQNRPFIAFSTQSTNIPTAGAGAKATHGGQHDMYLAGFSADGSELIFGTYVGGNGTDIMETHSLALDADGKPVLTFATNSTNLDTTIPAPPGLGGFSSAVFKFNLDGSVATSAIFGGSATDAADGIQIDADGRVYLSGETRSLDLPVTDDAYQSARPSARTAFVMVLSPDLTEIEYATYFGGSTEELLRALALADDGSFTAVGGTLSHDFPTINAYQDSFAGGNGTIGSGDLVIVRFVPIPEPASGAMLIIASLALFGVRTQRQGSARRWPCSKCWFTSKRRTCSGVMSCSR